MSLTGILVLIVIGLVAGWLAGFIWRGSGFGLIVNLIIGIAGSFLGVWMFRVLGISISGLPGLIIASVAGALILLIIINFIRQRI
ncbi:MAG TPA: GlsB/YeaQ/YmgE family stress response membrane protein [Spirochaetota bacterium]|nr:GlsB/YeaQ/YmgE family stress response membrane protein [Spirochaetota bacterium]